MDSWWDRELLTALARLSEGLAQYDLDGERDFADLGRLHCRERPGLVPFQIEGVSARPRRGESCPCRVLCRQWGSEMAARYKPRVIAFIDTGVPAEKQVCLLELSLGDGRLAVVVVFRGSKTNADWLRTNFNLLHQRVSVHTPGSTQDDGSLAAKSAARPMPMLKRSAMPCVSAGMWRAYDGRPGRRPGKASSPGDDDRGSPRSQVRQAVADILAMHATAGRKAQLILTGHSAGGTIATICAVDLALSSLSVYAQSISCITFGASRSFNVAFRSLVDTLRQEGRLHALRVVARGDLVPRLPFDCGFGLVHAVGPRLLLWPAHRRPLQFAPDADAYDRDQRLSWPSPAHHTCHAALLAGLPPLCASRGGRTVTVAADAEWPAAVGVATYRNAAACASSPLAQAPSLDFT